MTRQWAVTGTAVLIAALLAPAAVAHADPVAPQPKAPCPRTPAGTLTRLADGQTLLQCQGGHWAPFTDIYPSSDIWLTYGPALTLHGQARPNPEIKAGSWTGIPQSPGSQCSAQQSDVIDAGNMAPPQILTGDPGQPLALALTTQLATITLDGDCLWQRQP
jgi:hypothetical protein